MATQNASRAQGCGSLSDTQMSACVDTPFTAAPCPQRMVPTLRSRALEVWSGEEGSVHPGSLCPQDAESGEKRVSAPWAQGPRSFQSSTSPGQGHVVHRPQLWVRGVQVPA